MEEMVVEVNWNDRDCIQVWLQNWTSIRMNRKFDVVFSHTNWKGYGDI